MHPTGRRPDRHRHRSFVRLALVAGLAVAIAGCLPAAISRPTDPPPPTPRPTPTPDPTPSPTPPPPTPTPAPTFMLYKVKSGDTLTSIARKFKTDAKSISYWSRARHPSLDPESSKYSPDRRPADRPAWPPPAARAHGAPGRGCVTGLAEHHRSDPAGRDRAAISRALPNA